MAVTALAGPVSNFLLALALLFGASLLGRFAPSNGVVVWLFSFCLSTAALSVGLGLFNLVPIPPLDGSKVLFSLLPSRPRQGGNCHTSFRLFKVAHIHRHRLGPAKAADYHRGQAKPVNMVQRVKGQPPHSPAPCILGKNLLYYAICPRNGGKCYEEIGRMPMTTFLRQFDWASRNPSTYKLAK